MQSNVPETTSPLHALVERRADECQIELIRPHESSAPVVRVSAGALHAVVKRRSREWKGARECFNYNASVLLDLAVVSPCVALEASTAVEGSAWARCIADVKSHLNVSVEWGTAEEVTLPALSCSSLQLD